MVVKVAFTPTDDREEWSAIVLGLKAKYGTVKNAIRELVKQEGIVQ